eukprot:scaffold43886_cov61-Phaeocystis_antarctica.AAC.2
MQTFSGLQVSEGGVKKPPCVPSSVFRLENSQPATYTTARCALTPVSSPLASGSSRVRWDPVRLCPPWLQRQKVLSVGAQ